jgi:hypothetical protein
MTGSRRRVLAELPQTTGVAVDRMLRTAGCQVVRHLERPTRE